MDGMVRQLRDQNKAEEENSRVSGDNASSIFQKHEEGNDLVRQAGSNPVLPNAPEGFGCFDFAQAESRAMALYYANDEWADMKDSGGEKSLR